MLHSILGNRLGWVWQISSFGSNTTGRALCELGPSWSPQVQARARHQPNQTPSNLYKIQVEPYKEMNLGFQAGSTTITRSALVSVSPRPPTWDVRRKIGATWPSWKSWKFWWNEFRGKTSHIGSKASYNFDWINTNIDNLHPVTSFCGTVNS